MRKLLAIWIGVGALCAVSTDSALAFQETAAPAVPSAAKPKPVPGENLDLSGADQAPAVESKKGPEIRIPGLGTIGTLPKLDFGLELLYGTKEVPTIEDPGDDVGVRGTVKYRF